MSSSIGGSAANIDYALQLNDLVPKTAEGSMTLRPEEKEVRREKITQVLNEVFGKFNHLTTEQKRSLKDIGKLVKKADHMGLLSDSAKAVKARIFTPDLTIMTKDGEVRVNGALLEGESDYISRLLASGMRDAVERRVEWRNYSKETIETLVRCLDAPSSSKIELPPNQDVILELIDLATTYALEALIPRIETAVVDFIKEDPARFADRGEAWLHLLLSRLKGVLGENAQVFHHWIREMTPILLQYNGIPSSPSSLSGKFEIPIEYVGAFFDANTRDLLQVLPIMLVIKNPDDLKAFSRACQEAKTEGPLSITLLNLTEENAAEAQAIARSLSIDMEVEKWHPPNARVLGKEIVEQYYGRVGDVPPPPESLLKAINGPCPLSKTGERMADTHIFFYRPLTVDGAPLTINLQERIAESDKFGENKFSKFYEFIWSEIRRQIGDRPDPIERGYWAAVPKKMPQETLGILPAEKQQFLSTSCPGYESPSVVDAIYIDSLVYVSSGKEQECLLGQNPSWRYTICKETIRDRTNRDWHVIVGGLAPSGLNVSSDSPYGSDDVGVLPLRKFF